MLKVENLEAGYGASRVLHGVNFFLEPGRVAAVLGRNGVGKSTTVKSIMGLIQVTAGSVFIDGVDATRKPAHEIARLGVGYVPEGRMVFPDLTVLENILVAQRKTASRWTLSELFKLFPRLDERKQQKAESLSGGEQQMLVVARALATEPRLLILDEPSQGLAPLVVKELVTVFGRLRDEGLSILLVEQNLKLTQNVADEVYVMSKGAIVYKADIAEFRRDVDEVSKKYLTI